MKVLCFFLLVLLCRGDDEEDEALNAAKTAELEEAFLLFSQIKKRSKNHTKRARALHALASLSLILNADADQAGSLFRSAKAEDATAIPPLAELQMSGESCLGLGDVYWTTAFAVKRLASEPSAALEVHTSLGILLEDSGARDIAKIHFQKALTLKPYDTGLRFREALTVPAVLGHDSNATAVHLGLETKVNALLAIVTELPKLERLDQLSWPGTFYIVYLGGGASDPALMTALHTAYTIAYPGLKRNYLKKEEKVSSRETRPYKIGFVSTYLTRHSVCKLFCGVMKGLSRLDNFQVTLFSAAEKEDEFTQYVMSDTQKNVRLRRGALISNRDLALHLDALIFTDLGMDTRTFVWASARLAPIQILTWGHPHTSGMADTIDYFISSSLFEEDFYYQSPRYAEQLISFDSLGFFFRHPEDAGYGDTAGHNEPFAHNTTGPVLLCPQSLPKFHPAFDEVIVQLLDAIPNATVLITYDTKKTLVLRTLRKRIDPKLGTNKHRFLAIPLVRGRKFFALLRSATLLLDPFPFGGGVTTLEAFAVCKSVVTAPSLQTVPALAAGMYRHMRLADRAPIATDLHDYIQKVIDLTAHQNERAFIEEAICESRNDPQRSVFSSALAVDEWATFLRHSIESARKVEASS